MDMPDFKWLLTDSTYCRAYPHAVGTKWVNEGRDAQKGAQHKIHLAVDAHGMPVRIVIIEGTCADIRQAYSLVEGLSPKLVIADKAYSAKVFRNQLEKDDIQALIPESQRANKPQKEYDKQLDKVRHFIENTCLHLKQWRAVATRYARRASSFLAIVQARCIALYCKNLWWHDLGVVFR